jgi:hypothetical protein
MYDLVGAEGARFVGLGAACWRRRVDGVGVGVGASASASDAKAARAVISLSYQTHATTPQHSSSQHSSSPSQYTQHLVSQSKSQPCVSIKLFRSFCRAAPKRESCLLID